MRPLLLTFRRRCGLRWLGLLAAIALVLISHPLSAGATKRGEEIALARRSFKAQLTPTITADHPRIVPVAEGIRQVTMDPLEQLILVERVTRLLVDYDSDLRVYGRAEHHATLDEMIARAARDGWGRLRDDCDGRAVFAAHLLETLGIPWRLEASRWKRHAWVSARVEGRRYDLLDLEKTDEELQNRAYRWIGHRFVRASRPAPEFDWRGAWRARTDSSVSIGLELGLVEQCPRSGEIVPRSPVNWVRQNADGQAGRLAGPTAAGWSAGGEPHEAR